jgi:tetratricopeptide (TPR) repeat protein
MSNIIPQTPSFTFGYWRPWKENSNRVDSYFDYVKDTTLIKYGADTVGKYIQEASAQQVNAVNKLGEAIGLGMNVISNQLSNLRVELGFINENLQLSVEQQKLSNLLLQNIAELLRVPDSEKERQHSIELGIKFFVNAGKDADLYQDALEQFNKAESLMKQDYFVLHRIGCIYLYVEKYLDPEKALDYFLRAAKYASVESDPKAIRLVNALGGSVDSVNSAVHNDIDKIKLLAADSYEKAAFTAYVLGKFEDAEKYQSKAFQLSDTPENAFLLSKYQVRIQNIESAIKNLDKAIDEMPELALGVFKEIDLMNEPGVLELVEYKNKFIGEQINQLKEEWIVLPSITSSAVVGDLENLKSEAYDLKISQYNQVKKDAAAIVKSLVNQKKLIDQLIEELSSLKYSTLNSDEIAGFVKELNETKDFPLEDMENLFFKIRGKILILDLQNKQNISSEYSEAMSQKDEVIRKINKWTDDDKFGRVALNGFLSLILFIFIWIKFNFSTAMFCWAIYNTIFVLYSNFRVFSQTQTVIDIDLKWKIEPKYKSAFENLNFLTLIGWFLVLVFVIYKFV